ncbi:hypothetical protein CsSME_00052679 [Camellia sinensis var. sinensis]
MISSSAVRHRRKSQSRRRLLPFHIDRKGLPDCAADFIVGNHSAGRVPTFTKRASGEVGNLMKRVYHSWKCAGGEKSVGHEIHGDEVGDALEEEFTVRAVRESLVGAGVEAEESHMFSRCGKGRDQISSRAIASFHKKDFPRHAFLNFRKKILAF